MSQDFHPIQIQGIKVVELSLVVNDLNYINGSGGEFPFEFSTGTSGFDQELNEITIGVIGEIGKSSADSTEIFPFFVKAHLIAKFSVDVRNFPADKVDDWAVRNAPLVLLPFLREHIHGMAARAGITDAIVPLFTVPTFKVISSAKS